MTPTNEQQAVLEVLKKGQIVPKRLRFAVASNSKAQHCILFGCDVKVEGRRVTALSDGSIFYLRDAKRRMNNGTFKKCDVIIKNVHLCGAEFVVETQEEV